MTAFVLAFLPTLIILGFWQLDREQEKKALQSLYDLRQKSPSEALNLIDWTQTDLSYTKVQITGHFDNSHYFLLDNRIQDGRVGYEVLTPFLADSGAQVILNRGWVPQGHTRAQLPDISQIEGPARIEGSLYVPLSEPFMLSDAQETNLNSWPRVVQSIDIESWSTELDMSLAPYSIRLTQDSPGALVARWQTINMLPEKHRGYAVQWFAMAAALLLMYLYFATRSPTSMGSKE